MSRFLMRIDLQIAKFYVWLNEHDMSVGNKLSPEEKEVYDHFLAKRKFLEELLK